MTPNNSFRLSKSLAPNIFEILGVIRTVFRNHFFSPENLAKLHFSTLFRLAAEGKEDLLKQAKLNDVMLRRIIIEYIRSQDSQILITFNSVFQWRSELLVMWDETYYYFVFKPSLNQLLLLEKVTSLGLPIEPYGISEDSDLSTPESKAKINSWAQFISEENEYDKAFIYSLLDSNTIAARLFKVSSDIYDFSKQLIPPPIPKDCLTCQNLAMKGTSSYCTKFVFMAGSLAFYQQLGKDCDKYDAADAPLAKLQQTLAKL